jgi:hypothetical protein
LPGLTTHETYRDESYSCSPEVADVDDIGRRHESRTGRHARTDNIIFSYFELLSHCCLARTHARTQQTHRQYHILIFSSYPLRLSIPSTPSLPHFSIFFFYARTKRRAMCRI